MPGFFAPFSNLQTISFKSKNPSPFQLVPGFFAPLGLLRLQKYKNSRCVLNFLFLFCSMYCVLQKIMYFCGMKTTVKTYRQMETRVINVASKFCIAIRRLVNRCAVGVPPVCFQRSPLFLTPYY